MMDLMRKASTWTWIIHVLIWNICGSLRGASLLDLSFTRGSFSFSFSSASYPHSSSSWHSSLSASSSHSSFTCWQEQVFFFFLFFFFSKDPAPTPALIRTARCFSQLWLLVMSSLFHFPLFLYKSMLRKIRINALSDWRNFSTFFRVDNRCFNHLTVDRARYKSAGESMTFGTI